MSKVLPIGYRKNNMGRDMAIFFMILATILSVILVSAGMEIMLTAYLFAVAAILGGLLVLSDLASNKKNRIKISHMENMLKCPYVVGSVVEIKKYHYGFNRKLKEIKPGVYVKSKDCAYTILASFIDAENNEILVESDPYATNPEKNIENKRVRIHYSNDNEFWIDIN